MDSNPIDCPTCGHSVNTAAGACAYCGAIVSEGEQNQQYEDNSATDEPKVAESAAPLPEAETPPTDAISDQMIDTTVADKKPVDSESSQPAPQVPEPSDSFQMETAAELVTDSEPLSVAATDDYKSTDQAQTVEFDAELSRRSSTASDATESALTEVAVPEAKPQDQLEAPVEFMPGKIESESEIETQPDQPVPEIQAESQTEAAADEIQVSAEVETLDTSGDESADMATPGEGIRETVDTEDAHQEQAAQTSAETAAPAQIMGEDVKAEDKQNINSAAEPAEPVESKSDSAAEPAMPVESKSDSAAEPATPVESKSESASDVSEETILLDVADEVKIPPADPTVERAQMESPAAAGQPEVKPVDESAEMQKTAAEILKIEKAARDMADAIEKQKAAALEAKKAKAQALKQQKVALAKARAQKKQQIIMAKAAALKRKKAAQAKAQALKQQKADQLAVEPTVMEQVAAAQIDGSGGQPMINRSTKSENKMQELLEKYKGQSIGINYDFSAEIMAAQLVEANGDFFSVFVEDQQLHYSYPLKTILTVIEGQNGVHTDDSEQQDKFNAVIKVYPLGSQLMTTCHCS